MNSKFSLLANQLSVKTKAELDGIRHASRYHLPQQLIFGDLTSSLNLAGLHITEQVKLAHYFKG
jgi:hypothetical protein